jgi:3-oxoadipate enol-lactonase
LDGFVGTPRAVNGTSATAKLLDEARGYPVPDTAERIASIGDHETLVRDSGGDGPAIILIHAISMDGRIWKDVIPRLVSVSRVIAYDMRDHGQAEVVPLTTSLDHLIKDLLILMDALSIGKVDIPTYTQNREGISQDSRSGKEEKTSNTQRSIDLIEVRCNSMLCVV